MNNILATAVSAVPAGLIGFATNKVSPRLPSDNPTPLRVVLVAAGAVAAEYAAPAVYRAVTKAATKQDVA